MSRQQEEFERRAADSLKKAARETGSYRDVLLGVGEAYAALAFHQAVLDNWPRSYPAEARAGHQAVRDAREVPMRTAGSRIGLLRDG